MLTKAVIGLLVMMPCECIEKGNQKPIQQANLQLLSYTNEDRDSIIEIIARLKQGHLLFPIADAVFKASIKHALLDGKELSSKDATVGAVVELALANLSRTIKHTCPKRDFLDSIETMIEQMDDRYEEEAKTILKTLNDAKAKEGGAIELKTNIELAYAAAHYDKFNQKDLKHMVNLDKGAAMMLQERLQLVPKDALQTWYAEFMKGV